MAERPLGSGYRVGIGLHCGIHVILSGMITEERSIDNHVKWSHTPGHGSLSHRLAWGLTESLAVGPLGSKGSVLGSGGLRPALDPAEPCRPSSRGMSATIKDKTVLPRPSKLPRASTAVCNWW